MTTVNDYRICTKCEIHHYENCGSCFGYGVYKSRRTLDGFFPVAAAEAHSKEFMGEVLPCPECGSTENGIPKMVAA